MSTTMPSQTGPETVAWAMYVDHLGVVLVVEPSYSADAPPGLHLALSASLRTLEEVPAGNGWTARVWLPRSWGRVARVDLGAAL